VTQAPQHGTAALVQTLLDAESEREQQQAQAKKEVLFPDDLLPGVGEESISLRAGLKQAGRATALVCILLAAFDQLQSAGLSVLAPDIRDTFGVSSGVIVFIAASSGAFLVLGAVPMGWMADRFKRPPILGWAAIVFSVMVFVSGLAVNAFTFFLARFGVGMAQSSTLPVSGSIIADAYPIGLRGRIAAANGLAAGTLAALSPILVGGIASIAGGGAGWRWAFFLLGLPVLILAFFAFRLREPARGQYEMKQVIGEVIKHEKEAPISIEAAFSRLMQIKTIRSSIIAFSAIGFGLFTGPVLANLFLDHQYHLDSFHRGLAGTIGSAGVLVALPFAGKYYDAVYRRDPAKALKLIGYSIIPAAALAPVQYFMPNAVLWTIFNIPQTILLSVGFYMFSPVFQTIVPYRLRGLGHALGAIYIFFIGATGGALLSGLLISAFGIRTAVLTLLIPSTLIGGLLIVRSSRFIRADLSMLVGELREELDEAERQQASAETIPAIQVSGIDYAYGQVQVLFDIGFEVKRGETLALLGTNGAGKSTILRLIAGLGTPSRGVIRLNGQTITYVAPEHRARMGIQMLPGGKGVFSDMTITENLEIGSFAYRADSADRTRRIEKALSLFPELAQRRDDLASSLSGGQQQMLALARVLLHDPEVLIIDELSLGLAPIVVHELIEVIERLRATGLTMIVVEQSLNVAAAISDRAVFLEKGQVRFDGPTKDLLERNDLARAVFFGGNA
jgi:ABC-type branched-subunit amino acid transport system ATPase component/predicted MFS family arabinose efflux permease